MQIDDNWNMSDKVSGLRFVVEGGKNLDVLRVQSLTGGKKGDTTPKVDRAFFFAKDGEFTGTGSCLCASESTP